MEVKPGYKKTEVGVIPVEWEAQPITSVTHTIFLGLTSKVDYVSNGGAPLIRASDIASGKLSFFEARSISIKQHRELTRYRRAKRGNVLVSKSGSLGVCAIVDVDIEFSIYESIIVLQPTGLLDSSFLLSMLRDEATQTRMIGEKVGSTVSHLNLQMFRKLVVIIPPIPEQRTIAEALSDVDGLLCGLDRLIAKKRDLKQAAMQQLLTGQTRLPGFHGEWEVKKLGNIATCFSGGTPPTEVASYYGGDIPWITSGDLNKGYITEVEGRISQTGLANSAAQMIEANTLLIALYGATSGVTAISMIRAAINQAVLAIVPRHEDTTFLYFKLCLLKDRLISTFTQGGQPNLSGDIVKSVELPLPPLPEQTAIAEVLAEMEAELAALEQRREKTRALKQAMMQELLTGRTRLV